jgi:hypothetical protein
VIASEPDQDVLGDRFFQGLQRLLALEEFGHVLHDPPRQVRDRICEACGARLMDRPHDARCPRERPLVERLALTDEDRRLEDLLEVCTRRALAAWLRSGRTMP